jgi:hypothetical protein
VLRYVERCSNFSLRSTLKSSSRSGEGGSKTTENDLYDDLLKRLLRDRLHLGETNELVIAKRGTKNRTAAIAAFCGS